jgi:general secretion pathway protein A
VFIEQYKLETNPFASDAARPMFASHAMHYASQKLDSLLQKQIHFLFLSGRPGVGKTALARYKLRHVRDTIAWVKPPIETKEALLTQLLEDVGPGAVEGTADELRRILEVFLRHQAGNGRATFLAVDALERFSPPLLREFEALAQWRLRGRPLLHILYVTRNEELVDDFLPLHEGGPLARAVHQPLTGFTMEETRAYVRACLRGAGCDWSDELLPDDVLTDVQAYTRGVVADVNALCRDALNAVAARSASSTQPPRITQALLKEAAAALNLRYDPSAWEPVTEETLSPEAVHLSDPGELRMEAARLIVSSGRQVVAEISLNRPRMVLGRDDSCDISLDSRYVSRYQNLFMETPEGWLLIDLSSTNGCFVNGRRVREHRLRDGDLIAIGHHQLRFAGPQPSTGRTGQHPLPRTGDARGTDETVVGSPLAMASETGPKPTTSSGSTTTSS